MHEVPSFGGLDHVGERRHWRAVDSGHEDLVEIGVRRPAFEARARLEVVGMNWLIAAVNQASGRGAVTAPLFAVALKALKLGEDLLALLEAVEVELGFRRDRNGRARLLGFPARRKRLDEGNEIGALLIGQFHPGWHA